MRTVDFHEWLQGCGWRFDIGYLRYNQFHNGDNYLACASYDREDIPLEVQALDSGDEDAIKAARKLKMVATKGDIYIATDKNPAEALQKVVNELQKYHSKL